MFFYETVDGGEFDVTHCLMRVAELRSDREGRSRTKQHPLRSSLLAPIRWRRCGFLLV